MTFELGFREEALKEWRKLDVNVRDQFKTKLTSDSPILACRPRKLAGHPDRYKIKLKSVGYRLVLRSARR